MKTLTYILLVSSIVPAFGQSKFALSAQIAPIYAHTDSKITIGPTSGISNQPPSTQITSVLNSLNYSFGISARYTFSSRWSIATGIWATHTAVAKAGAVQDGIAYTAHYRYNHPFTNLYRAPLLINYQSSSKRLSPYFSVGATFDFRGTSYADVTGNGDYVPVRFGKAVVFTPLVGVGFLYDITAHLTVIAQPTIQYNVESHSTYAYYHSYQLSLQTQIMYKF